MLDDNVMMGQIGAAWDGNGSENGVKSITFCVTEDCNLACKYCYMTGKNHKKKMSFEIAKKSVDYLLENRKIFNENAVVWDFIGGEPFLEIELIDKICDYIKLRMYTLKHPWFNAYRFSFSTNGLLYASDEVQKFIRKNDGHLSIGISLDGNEIKHDLQRVYPDGRGSYKDVIKNVPLWKSQFINGQTKATFAHDDLPFLKDSILSLWGVGINTVAANVVFEDVWHEGDDKILEQQLNELADYIIENKLWDDYSVRFFDPVIGYPLKEEDKHINFCGAGKMLAIDCDGIIYPCIRFMDFSLTNKKGRKIGDIFTGINNDLVRPFLGLTVQEQSKAECIECDIASGCAWCTGFNYDASEDDTIFERATFICNMHKATVRSNKRFWKMYEEATGKPSPRRKYEREQMEKYLYIITNDNITSHCDYTSGSIENSISEIDYEKALQFAKINNFEVVALGNINSFKCSSKLEFSQIDSVNSNSSNADYMPIYDNEIRIGVKAENCILKIRKENIENIYSFVKKIYRDNKRININLEQVKDWNQTDIEKYRSQLELLIDLVEETYMNNNPVEINVLTDRLVLTEHCNCDAGVNSITLAPNGRFYICPAFYFYDKSLSIGDLESGLRNFNNSLLKLEKSPICNKCDAYQCKRCVFLNKILTREYNIPSKNQCLISHAERNVTILLQNRLKEKGLIENNNSINEIDYNDPIEKLLVLQKER